MRIQRGVIPETVPALPRRRLFGEHSQSVAEGRMVVLNEFVRIIAKHYTIEQVDRFFRMEQFRKIQAQVP